MTVFRAKRKNAREKKEQLREVLLDKVKALRDEAVQNDGKISAEKLEALVRLAQLAELYNGAQPPQRQRWPVIVMLGATMLIVSILHFKRVTETEIELDLGLSEVSFTLSKQQVLTDVMQLSKLGVSGLRAIQLPRIRDHAAQTFEETNLAIQLSVASDQEITGTINLAVLNLPAHTHVSLRSTEVPQQYRLSLKGIASDLRADVNGLVRVEVSGASAEPMNFSSPKTIHLQPDTSEVTLDLIFPEASRAPFSPQLVVDNLSFLRIDRFMGIEFSFV